MMIILKTISRSWVGSVEARCDHSLEYYQIIDNLEEGVEQAGCVLCCGGLEGIQRE